MSGRKIIARRRFCIRIAGETHTALSQYDNAFTHSGYFAESRAQDFFGFTAAIDVGGVKQREAGIVGCNDGLPSGGPAFGSNFFRFPRAGDAPAAVSEATGLEGTVAE